MFTVYFTLLLVVNFLTSFSIVRDGNYEWHGNGIRARQSVHVDILAVFERILDGSTESLPNFTITAQKNFEIKHSTGATKSVRFTNLKGAQVGEGREASIRFWHDSTEFALHASSLKPIGWDSAEPSSGVEAGSAKRRMLSAPQTSSVYIIRGALSGAFYVGCSVDVEKRLRQHNREISKGAAATAGDAWSVARICRGFTSRGQALKFEARLQHSASPLTDAPLLAQETAFEGVVVELLV